MMHGPMAPALLAGGRRVSGHVRRDSLEADEKKGVISRPMAQASEVPSVRSSLYPENSYLKQRMEVEGIELVLKGVSPGQTLRVDCYPTLSSEGVQDILNTSG